MGHRFLHRVAALGVLAPLLLWAGCAPEGAPNPVPVRAAGALIQTSMTSQVGVLLDELPASLRDKAASALLEKPKEFWLSRARQQVKLTEYRLVYRTYFYEGKGQLPLPPVKSWTLTLAPAAPKRTTVDGHDVVLVSYTYEATLLSDAGSPGKAEPALTNPSGAWDEPYILPVDPELLFQRTGYACADEDEEPPNSVDGENIGAYYDQDCTVAPPDCHVTPKSVTEDCVGAIEAHVGKVQTSMHFERLAWDAALADKVRVEDAPPVDGAELAVIGEGLENNRVIYRYIPEDSCAIAEGCVGASGWRRLLQFDASVKNLGKKALNIGDVDYFISGGATKNGDHHVYEYSACHRHYHFSHYGDFIFGTGAGQTGQKRAFCLVSTSRYGNNEYSPLTNPYSSCAYQGIEAGWGDDYNAGIECQWIDVTQVDTSKGAVKAPLTFVANPDQFLCEGKPILDAAGNPTFAPTTFKTAKGEAVDRPACTFVKDWDANNTQARDAVLREDGGLITAPCARGQLGPLRDCGFSEQKDTPSRLGCKPGEKVNLLCSIADPTTPAVLRVCERSLALGVGVACTYRDALANQTIDDYAAVSFTCPAARDAKEPGGLLALYGAPVLPEGKAQPISCVVAP